MNASMGLFRTRIVATVFVVSSLVLSGHADVFVDASNISDPLQDGSSLHPFDTLAEGIAAATNGETVYVADGLYLGSDNKNLSFSGKAITLTSTGTPGSVVVDCEGSGRGFHFSSGESSDSVLHGFTIRNGYTPAGECGAAILMENSAPTIESCFIENNLSEAFGSGICSLGSSNLFIVDTTFVSNGYWTVETGYGMLRVGGAALYAEASSGILVSNCTFANNRALGIGGGILLTNSDGLVATSLFISNHVALIPGEWKCHGTAIYCGGGFMQAIDSRFLQNTGETGGGENSEAGLDGLFLVSGCEIGGHTRGVVDAHMVIASYVHDNDEGVETVFCVSNRYERNAVGLQRPFFVKGSTFLGNTDIGVNAAIDDDVFIENCSFVSNNTAVSCGAGFFGPKYTSIITRSEFISNILGIRFASYSGATQIAGFCRFTENQSAAYVTGQTVLDNCLFEDTAGPVVLSAGSAYLRFCTIVHPSTASVFDAETILQYGGCQDAGKGMVDVFATILWNLGGPVAAIETNSFSACGDQYIQTNVLIRFSDVQGGSNQVWFGEGCINADPLFLSATDRHLPVSSPCIDTVDMTGTTSVDLDGSPRPLDGNNDGVTRGDMGAYEIFDSMADSDGDGMSDGDELRAGTWLTDPASVLAITSVESLEGGNAVTWQAMDHRSYWLQYTTNLQNGVWFDLQSEPFAETNGYENTPLSIVDTNATPGSVIAYRVLLAE